MGMSRAAKDARETILRKVDELTEPSRMSKAEAKDLLEELCADLEGRIECLKEEMANE